MSSSSLLSHILIDSYKLNHTYISYLPIKLYIHQFTYTSISMKSNTMSSKPRKVPVVYYLSRNGNLDHPHFIEVPLSSSNALHLRDVINRLNSLRGNGMAASYSWSSKRSYKNGFVWQDLAENDYIYPAHGEDYILKGSELEELSLNFKSMKSSSPEEKTTGEEFPVIRHRRNQSMSAIDLHTGTDDKLRRRKTILEQEIKEEAEDEESSELNTEEISPPPSDSSPETDGKLIIRSETDDRKQKNDPTDGNKVKASTVLKQLISCGSFRGCDNPGFSLISHYKSRMLPRGGEDGVVLRKNGRSKKQMVNEDKEYFSGSLLQTKKEEFSGLQRSKSYTVNR
ncbi:hypothetical protein QVD17_02850 [Tagetes erecta]|uniref:SOSEKI DIX-like domain-containing protein n=1 Tax=Tagetes erecta TaxID=13708 RepID=A0AAD8LGF8_TARER|nr:hypothetical protein QVD17_02850 [Tagetes erecta]